MRTETHTPILVLAVFALLFAVEKWFPLRRSRAGLISRLIVNGLLSGLVFLIAATAVHPSALRALGWASDRSFGLLPVLGLPTFWNSILGFLLLDLGFYYWHVINHRVPLLWRFHNVHHTDPDLDVSTGFRFHFGEVLISTLFRVVQVSLTGVSLGTFVVYEVVFQCNTLFHHSNLRLPIRWERGLNLVLVTPRMHGIHHSQVRRETNSNYGVVFPWWDRLHRTLGLNIPQSKIEIGVPGYSAPENNRLRELLRTPFVRQRDYWRRADGSIPERAGGELQGSVERLAE